jgi:3-hydroxyacyl-CoA dehydrogenase, NAD binding domain.
MVNGNLRKGHAVVLGAGTMGSGIAALLASIGWRVHCWIKAKSPTAHWNACSNRARFINPKTPCALPQAM